MFCSYLNRIAIANMLLKMACALLSRCQIFIHDKSEDRSSNEVRKFKVGKLWNIQQRPRWQVNVARGKGHGVGIRNVPCPLGLFCGINILGRLLFAIVNGLWPFLQGFEQGGRCLSGGRHDNVVEQGMSGHYHFRFFVFVAKGMIQVLVVGFGPIQ